MVCKGIDVALKFPRLSIDETQMEKFPSHFMHLRKMPPSSNYSSDFPFSRENMHQLIFVFSPWMDTSVACSPAEFTHDFADYTANIEFILKVRFQAT